MTHPTFLSVVVSTHDVVDTIGPWLRTLSDYLATQFAVFEIVVVDDASSDATAAAAVAVADDLAGSLCVVELGRRHGIELAMLAGLSRATGDWIVELDDCPPAHPLTLIDELYELAARGHDVVAATPGSSTRLTGLFYAFVNRMSYLDEPLATERTRMVSRRALNAMLDLEERTRYRKALYSLTGLPKTNLDYTPDHRPARSEDPRTLTTALDILIAYSNIGPRAAQLLAVAFGMVSVLAVIYVIVINLTRESVVEGWTTVMILLSFGLAGVFFTLGMIGEYLARILREVRGRPLYAIEREQTYVSASEPRSSPRTDTTPTP